jgi:VCBS repeat-containing protein
VPANGVLANDVSANGNALTAVLASGPAHGTVSLNADGSFTYTPTANFVGSDSFTYQAKGSDGTLSTAAPVTILVTYHFGGFLAPLSSNFE